MSLASKISEQQQQQQQSKVKRDGKRKKDAHTHTHTFHCLLERFRRVYIQSTPYIMYNIFLKFSWQFSRIE